MPPSLLSVVSGTLTTTGLVTVGIVPAILIAITYMRYNTYDPESRIVDLKQIQPEYDFVVVGGGSAGSVVASRLSENRNWTVLLLEAGSDETEISDVPALASYTQLSDLDWQYKTAPPSGDSLYCLAMIGDRCNWPRGKVLGGSSVLNAMIYARGNKRDYDGWAALGNEGWSYKDVLPYFKKSEDNRNPYLAKSAYHGRGGLLTVQESPWRSPLAVAFVKAGEELGYENRDLNGEKQTGFMLAQGTIRRGSRCSTAKAFLRPVRLRDNLHIALRSHVMRVLFEKRAGNDSSSTVGEQPTARAVQYQRDGQVSVVKARKEIILSAGAIGSAQILMLSGVGPAEHLKDLDIRPVKDLKVGHNLQDHVGLGGLTFLVDEPVTFKRSRHQTTAVALEYVVNERGPLTTLGGVEGIAFVNTKYADPSGLYPDIQYHFAASSINSDGEQIKKILALRDRVYNTMYKPLLNAETWTLLPLLLRPKSVGSIRLKSKTPFMHPVIEPNYFARREDVLTLIEGIRLAFNISNTPAFQAFNSRPLLTPMPGCRKHRLFSDEYWECAMRHFTFTIYHPVGTCKMGVDQQAVVDPRLRVHGVKGLRVIDGSIMPTIVSANPNAPIIMIGEKGSDMIKQDWSFKDAPRKKRGNCVGRYCRRQTSANLAVF